uniref:Uncharacterized protein n=1 Tax=Arundo donax TaxID=35708 RepID=A0A0A9GYB1_ARUDO
MLAHSLLFGELWLLLDIHHSFGCASFSYVEL